MVGLTAISAVDEEIALDLILKQRELLKPIAEHFDGKGLKEIGGDLLLSFSNSIKTVRCSIQH
jgi:hypothetical protein